MIARLSGTIAHIDPKYIVVDVAGVGYKVYSPADNISKMKLGTTAKLFTYLAVRDDALDLYGFPSSAELAFFELLISVSGIGPKTALGILGVATIGTLETAISSGDISHLTKVSGIGKRNAEKIVMELRDKIDGLNLGGGDGSSVDERAATVRADSDVLEALKSLGYREAESREALKKLDRSIVDTGAKVKAALKILSK